MARILLLRHGESEWNVEGRWQGHADPALSGLGRIQAAHAAGHLDPVDLIVASDLSRAVETATIIADAVGVASVRTEEGVRERDAGAWEGLTRAEIEAGWPGYLQSGRRPPGFEDDESLIGRTSAVLRELACAHDGARILVVSHGGVIRSHERRLGAPAERVPNLGGRWLAVHGASIELGERIVLVAGDEITRPPEH